MNEDQSKDYVELVENSANIRVELDEVIKPRLGAIKKLVKRTFGQKPALFNFAKNMQYYQGGYPKAESAAKLIPYSNKLAHLVMIYEATGQLDNLNSFFSQFGIEVNRVKTCANPYLPDTVLLDEKAKKIWDSWIKRPVPKSSTEFMKLLMTEALDCQKEICETADQVSVDAASKAENEFGLKKGSFMQAVSIKTADIKKGDGEEKLANIDEKISNLELAIEPLRLK